MDLCMPEMTALEFSKLQEDYIYKPGMDRIRKFEDALLEPLINAALELAIENSNGSTDGRKDRGNTRASTED